MLRAGEGDSGVRFNLKYFSLQEKNILFSPFSHAQFTFSLHQTLNMVKNAQTAILASTAI